MDFQQWLTANSYDETKLSATQRTHLEAAWKAETQPAPVAPVVAPATTYEQEVEAIRKEDARQTRIREITTKAMSASLGSKDKIDKFEQLAKDAVADKWDITRFELAMLREERSVGPFFHTPRTPEATGDMLEAALCMSGGLENVEKHYSEQTLDAARKQFKGMGLLGMIGHCARRNGWNGHDVKANWFSAVKYGFRDNGEGGMYAATTGPSTYSLPNLLSNVANKFLHDGFMAVDSSWRQIAEITRFNDFKTKTEAGLVGSLLYTKIGPSGEIKHGDITEIAYTNQASTYAVMLGIDRQSLVNDDLGALTGVSKRIGRGYALTLNSIVWTAFLDNASFFAAGNSNVITGGTSVLSGATGLEALRLAYNAFMLQTDPNGQPLGSTPKILLVPTALEISARNLINSTTVVGTTTANSLMPDQNAFANAFKIVSSPYLQNSTYTGYSATAWYLLSDPQDVPVLEVGFLNGVDSPTVETENAEFSMLGIALRGYFDAGAAKKEYRGGLRAAGA